MKKCRDKRLYIIDAHHINPDIKEFNISDTRGIKSIKLELEKCIPLCSNCHKEFHYFQKLNKINIEDYLEKIWMA